jgi:hypothetical protein
MSIVGYVISFSLFHPPVRGVKAIRELLDRIAHGARTVCAADLACLTLRDVTVTACAMDAAGTPPSLHEARERRAGSTRFERRLRRRNLILGGGRRPGPKAQSADRKGGPEGEARDE